MFTTIITLALLAQTPAPAARPAPRAVQTKRDYADVVARKRARNDRKGVRTPASMARARAAAEAARAKAIEDQRQQDARMSKAERRGSAWVGPRVTTSEGFMQQAQGDYPETDEAGSVIPVTAERTMTSQALAGLLLRQPFQRFAFVLDPDTEVWVDRPEEVRHKAGDRIVAVLDRSGGETLLDLDLVAMIEVKPPGAK